MKQAANPACLRCSARAMKAARTHAARWLMDDWPILAARLRHCRCSAAPIPQGRSRSRNRGPSRPRARVAPGPESPPDAHTLPSCLETSGTFLVLKNLVQAPC